MRTMILILMNISPIYIGNSIPEEISVPPVEGRSVDITTFNSFIIEAVTLEFIRREGIHEVIADNVIVSYRDPGNKANRAIGIGHCRSNSPSKISFNEAFELLYSDLNHFVELTKSEYPNLNANETLAIAMLAHNIGFGAIGRSLNKELRSNVKPKTLLKYVKVNGKTSSNLITAREFEYALFLGDTTKLKSTISINASKEAKKYIRYGKGNETISANLCKARIRNQILASKNYSWWN